MRPAARWLIIVGACLVVLAWGYSVVRPNHFGACSEIPVRFGPHPTITDCHAYGPTDFLVPLAVIVILGLILGDDDFEMDLGPLGKYSRKRRGEKAAAQLQESNLDARGEAFIQSLGQD